MSLKMSMLIILLAATTATTSAFVVSPQTSTFQRQQAFTLGYEPKWKKKQTLADQQKTGGGKIDFTEIGLKGSVNVVFRQGNETKSTIAMVGQPLRDVASQAGQFVKYGCGKGECGTCEALVDGKWVRPCIAVVPPECESLGADQSYTVQLKEIKSKSVSSGKFYSVRSFFLGFWNNLLGMVGFVKYRRAANRNWQERQEYEDLIKQKVAAKKLARELEKGEGSSSSSSNDGTLAP